MANNLKKLNLGCGKQKLEGYIGIDIKDYGQEIVRDITRGLPFDDNSVDEIFASHFFEHLSGEDVIFVLEECYRVLKPNCEIEIRVPHSQTDEAFYPDHKSFWNEKMVQAMLSDPYQKGKFDFLIVSLERVGIELRIRLRKLT